MKNTIIGIALALALVMGVVAFAETAETATDFVPAVTEKAPAEEAAPSAEAEKADLILNSVKERLTARNDECLNCGYQFQNKGARMAGGVQTILFGFCYC